MAPLTSPDFDAATAIADDRSPYMPRGFDALLLLPLIPLFLLPNFVYNFDEVVYVGWLEHMGLAKWVHPHHLGYMPLVAAVRALANTLGMNWDPATAMVWVSRVAAIAGIWLMSRCFLRMRFSWRWTLLACWLAATGFTYWQWSTTGGSYTPLNALLLWLFLELLHWPEGQIPLRRILKAGAILILAVAIHELAILVLPSILAWLWWRGDGPQERQTNVVRTGLVLGLMPAAMYLIVFAALRPLLPDDTFFGWITTYGQKPLLWIWNQDLGGPARAFAVFIARASSGHLKLLWATPFYEWFPPENPLVPTALFLPLILGAVVWMVSAIKCGLRLWRDDLAFRHHALLALCWSAPFFLLTLVFESHFSCCRIPYLMPLIFLMVAPWALSRTATWKQDGFNALAVLLAVTFLVNLAAAYIPRTSRAINPYLVSVQAYERGSPTIYCFPVTAIDPLHRDPVIDQWAYAYAWSTMPVARGQRFDERLYQTSGYGEVPIWERVQESWQRIPEGCEIWIAGADESWLWDNPRRYLHLGGIQPGRTGAPELVIDLWQWQGTVSEPVGHSRLQFLVISKEMAGR